jgi:hypothetical protein
VEKPDGEKGWKAEQTRQQAITGLEIENRNQRKWRKVYYKNRTKCRSNREWILAFQCSTFIVNSELNSY